MSIRIRERTRLSLTGNHPCVASSRKEEEEEDNSLSKIYAIYTQRLDTCSGVEKQSERRLRLTKVQLIQVDTYIRFREFRGG